MVMVQDSFARGFLRAMTYSGDSSAVSSRATCWLPLVPILLRYATV